MTRVDTGGFSTTTTVRRRPEQFERIQFRLDGPAARMTLSRPEHNLLNEAMLRELADGISYAGENDAVKLIVLDSACKVFCGGIDVGEYTFTTGLPNAGCLSHCVLGNAGSRQAGHLRSEWPRNRRGRGARGVR